MPLKDVFKVSRKTFINPSEWLGYDAVKDQSKTIVQIIREGTTPRQATRTETFAAAMERLHISEKNIEAMGRTYFYYSLVFVVLTAVDLVYGLDLLFHHHAFLGMVLSLAVSGLLLAQAFKYSFWSFQIKQQRLGCTMKEWRADLFKFGK